MDEGFQPGVQALPLHADEGPCGGQQLVLGKEHVAVVGIVLQLKEESGLHPLGVVPRHAQLNGQLVHLGEGDVQATVSQKIGVILHHLHR